ncbi:ABC transporter membrane-spanning protein [Actinomadura vinacea]|uniref:ABC transporter membrane-spanning protein n=1 Tax=Actinomadura vinacea TaxID=115336 RepID=A0ABP5VV94_9ACTN
MNALTGTGTLLRLGLRRDRVMIPIWVLVLASFPITTLSSYQGLYKTQAERADFIAGVNGNATQLAFYGEAHSASLGGLTAWRMTTLGVTLLAIMTLMLVVRHTRAEEEEGRLELVGSGVVDRHAPLTAALLVAVVANAALALLAALSLAGQGLAGAFAFGLAWFAGGFFFAGVAAVAAQVTENSRAARGITVAVIGLAFAIRAVGDSSEGAGWLTWLSPIGWSEHVQAFAGNRFWVLAVPLVLGAALMASAYGLIGRRDHGAGLVPSRPGPATAAPALRSPLALAWRLQRGSLIAWVTGFAAYGVILGTMADGVRDLVGDSEGTQDIVTRLGGASDLVDAYLAAMVGLLAGIASIYGVQAAMRLRTEETAQRAEPVLATGIGRVRWACSHLAIALAGTLAMLLGAGLMIGLAHGAATGDLGGEVADELGAVLVQVPAVWLVTAIAVALFGLAPRFSVGAAWGLAGTFLLIGQLGPLLEVSQAVMDLSPFTHVPKLPGGTVTATPLAALLAIMVVLIGAGLYGFRRRDIAT